MFQDVKITAANRTLYLDIQAVAVISSADKHAGHFSCRAESVHLLDCSSVLVPDSLVVMAPPAQHEQQGALCSVADKLHALDVRDCCVVCSVYKKGLHIRKGGR